MNMDSFLSLQQEFNDNCNHYGINFAINIVRQFSLRNCLSSIEGLPGMLQYIEKIIYISECNNIKVSFFELAYSLWALEKLGRMDWADRIAHNLCIGGDFGDTKSIYNEGGNFFRNFELELEIGLRLLEAGIEAIPGDEGQPDYLISNDYVIEVKAPASKKALCQDILKAVKQIEKGNTYGIIIVCLDHMVARNMIGEVMKDLSNQIVDIITSLLPSGTTIKTIGIIAEWVNWKMENNCICTIEPFMLKSMHTFEREQLVRKVWQAIGVENVEKLVVNVKNSNHPFPYSHFTDVSEINATEDGKAFYEKVWGEN